MIIPEKYVEKWFETLDKEILPHGSGFNGNWHFSFNQKTKNIRCSNYYSVMENGMYVHHCHFTVILNWNDADYFKVMIHGNRGRYYARKHDLRSYIEETIWQNLESYISEA